MKTFGHLVFFLTAPSLSCTHCHSLSKYTKKYRATHCLSLINVPLKLKSLINTPKKSLMKDLFLISEHALIQAVNTQ